MPISLIALAALFQPTPVVDCAMLRFSVAPALGGTFWQVSVCPDPEAGPGEFLFRATSRRRGEQPTLRYATTRTCPASRRQLQALEELELPHPDLPSLGNDTQVLTLDGAGYVLEGSGRYGEDGAEIRIESNVMTPLADWVQETLEALAPCWRERP